jgi:predicted DsbA family dithiol-disulfide isomerase
VKKHSIKIVFAILLVLFCTWPASAEVECDVEQIINLGEKPIDMVSSARGTYLFVLTDDGVIHIYDSKGNIKGDINVGRHIDHIACGPTENSLLLKSKKEKEIQKIAFEFIEKIDTEGSPYMGNANAPIVITVFSDYQCPYCARLSPTFDQVMAHNKDTVKIVFKNFPLPMHGYARNAAAAALVANKMGEFLKFHEALYENRTQLSDEKVLKIATSLGLNPDEFEKEMKSKEIQNKINQDIRDAEKAGATGTPTIFINGRRLRDRSLEGFQDVIDNLLKKKNKD